MKVFGRRLGVSRVDVDVDVVDGCVFFTFFSRIGTRSQRKSLRRPWNVGCRAVHRFHRVVCRFGDAPHVPLCEEERKDENESTGGRQVSTVWAASPPLGAVINAVR